MRLAKHRTCAIYMNRQCRAIEGYGGYRKWCSLGFSITYKSEPLMMMPNEPCPKPMTNDDMVEAFENPNFNKLNRRGIT